MKRTTVMLPEDMLARAHHEARRRGVPLAEIVREAMERHLPPPDATVPLSFIGIGEGVEDGGERVDDYVRDAMRSTASSQ